MAEQLMYEKTWQQFHQTMRQRRLRLWGVAAIEGRVSRRDAQDAQDQIMRQIRGDGGDDGAGQDNT